MIRELAYEAFSRAFWATMGTLARLAFWALGPEPVSAPPVRASRAHPMPIATEARVPFNAGKYGPAEAELRAEGVNVDAFVARTEATIATGRQLRADLADPRGLAREVAEALDYPATARGSSYVEYARNFVGDLSKGERSMLTPNLRARVEAYRAAVGAS